MGIFWKHVILVLIGLKIVVYNHSDEVGVGDCHVFHL